MTLTPLDSSSRWRRSLSFVGYLSFSSRPDDWTSVTFFFGNWLMISYRIRAAEQREMSRRQHRVCNSLQWRAAETYSGVLDPDGSSSDNDKVVERGELGLSVLERLLGSLKLVRERSAGERVCRSKSQHTSL